MKRLAQVLADPAAGGRVANFMAMVTTAIIVLLIAVAGSVL